MPTRPTTTNLAVALGALLLAGLATLLALPSSADAEQQVAVPPGVEVPGYPDQYCGVIRQLEAGKTEVDYRAFRESLLQSEQFKVIQQRRPEFDALRKTLPGLMKESKYTEILGVTRQMLGIDYTDLEAHKILQQTYRALGNAAQRQKYHDIEFGLLNSIVKNGDGKTCKTGWPVVQVKEEYFILGMLGAKVLKQTLDTKDEPCDRMEVQTHEGPMTCYFNVAKVFEGYKKLGLK